MDDRIKKMLAVAASVGANCHPCLEYHAGKALSYGIEKSELMEVVEIAKAVRRGAAVSMDKLALNLLSDDAPGRACGSQDTSCCCS